MQKRIIKWYAPFCPPKQRNVPEVPTRWQHKTHNHELCFPSMFNDFLLLGSDPVHTESILIIGRNDREQ